MKKLIGTEKQVAWANDLRIKYVEVSDIAIRYYTDKKDALRIKLENLGRDSECIAQCMEEKDARIQILEDYRAYILGHEKASFFIDRFKNGIYNAELDKNTAFHELCVAKEWKKRNRK
ncbi:MAG: hypothetical protein FWE25_03370 [Lachnospiraceae bacterium]|nr:hypothetical protein [Lachnospiraceae bacterium]